MISGASVFKNIFFLFDFCEIKKFNQFKSKGGSVNRLNKRCFYLFFLIFSESPAVNLTTNKRITVSTKQSTLKYYYVFKI